jgi:hypothetical protein
MNEIVPIALGFASGVLIGGLTPRRRLAAWLAVSVLLGVAATVLTGEWRISWAFVLIDIPLVAAAALVGHLGARNLSGRWVAAHRVE